MPVLACVECRCELERFTIAGGRVIVMCVACESIGDAVEVAAGARLQPVDKPVAVSAGRTSGIR